MATIETVFRHGQHLVAERTVFGTCPVEYTSFRWAQRRVEKLQAAGYTASVVFGRRQSVFFVAVESPEPKVP